MNDMIYGKKLKSLRKKRGLSREDVASKLQVSYATVLRWENGSHKPLKAFQRALAILLK